MSLQAIGDGTQYFPCRVPPIAFASERGGIRILDATGLTLAVVQASRVVAAPLDCAWWSLLGPVK